MYFSRVFATTSGGTSGAGDIYRFTVKFRSLGGSATRAVLIKSV